MVSLFSTSEVKPAVPDKVKATTPVQPSEAQIGFGILLGDDMVRKLLDHEPSPEEVEDDTRLILERRKFTKKKKFNRTKLDDWHLKVKSFIKTVPLLLEFNNRQTNREWFESMLVAYLYKTKFSKKRDVSLTLPRLTEEDGETIGSALRPILLNSTEAEEGVGRWIKTYPVLKELDKKELWFRRFMVVLAEPTIQPILFGFKVKVYVSLFVGYGDCLTDGYAIYVFWSLGLMGAVYKNVSYILINLFFQCLVAWAQTKECGWKVMLREMFYVVCFIKPAIDAHRYVSGIKTHPDALFSSLVEMISGKVSEMVCEAIPCGVSQTKIWIVSEVKSSDLAMSILFSSLAIGYGSGLISYNADTAPENRKTKKRF